MSFELNGSFKCKGDEESECSVIARKAFEDALWRQRVENYNRKAFKHLSARHQLMIEHFINSRLGYHRNERDDIQVNEIKNGRISFAYENMDKFPRSVVQLLRHDITHLDLSMNKIRDFEFLRGFTNLKSLVVDGNCRLNMESFPTIGTLELFYANKCNIEFSRSFIFRVTTIFESLKYFSMMGNPAFKRPTVNHAWESRDHRLRMFAIFMAPNLIHFNDKKITDDEKEYSKSYHEYLGPTDSKLSKFKTLPDTDDIRKMLPVHTRKMTRHILSMEAQDDAESLDEALSTVCISNYFANRQLDNISIGSSSSLDYDSTPSISRPSSRDTLTTDEGLGSLAPSELSFD